MVTGKFTGKPHISWENPWFPVDFPVNQSIVPVPSSYSYQENWYFTNFT
jgi:hypothetical protein